MGIEGSIRLEQKSRWSPGAWLSVMPGKTPGSRGKAILQDSLCKQHSLAQVPAGVRINHSWTSRDLAKRFFQPVQEHFYSSSSAVRVIVFSLDDDFNTPKEKAREQAQRDKARPQYAKDVDFVDHGVVRKLPISPTETVDQVELIDLAKVIASRTVRKKLWQYYLKYMKTVQLPLGTSVILSFDRAGPWLFQGGKAPVQMTQWCHNLGETDVGILFWIWMLRDFDLEIETIDTDYIPICFSYLSAAPTDVWPKSLIWKYEEIRGSGKAKSKTNQIVDLLKLYKNTTEITALKPQAFVLACVLCSTDFFDKQLVFAQIQPGLIFEAVQTSQEYVFDDLMDSLFITDLDEEALYTQGISAFTLLVQVVYTLLLVSHKKAPAGITALIDNNRKRKREKEHEQENPFSQEFINKKIRMEQQAALNNQLGALDSTENSYKIKKHVRETEPQKIWTQQEIKSFLALNSVKKYAWPTDQNIATAFKQFKFNMIYWLRSWQPYSFKRTTSIGWP